MVVLSLAKPVTVVTASCDNDSFGNVDESYEEVSDTLFTTDGEWM